MHDREAEQVSQQKWEEIHHKKTLLVDELRLAGKAAVDFPNLRPQLAQHIQTLQLEVQELEAYIKFVSNFQWYESESSGCLVRQRVSFIFFYYEFAW